MRSRDGGKSVPKVPVASRWGMQPMPRKSPKFHPALLLLEMAKPGPGFRVEGDKAESDAA